MLHEAGFLVGEVDGERRNILHVSLTFEAGDAKPWRLELRDYGSPTKRSEARYETEAEARAVLDALYREARPLGEWQLSSWGRPALWGTSRRG
jgi:hypothetical protein